MSQEIAKRDAGNLPESVSEERKPAEFRDEIAKLIPTAGTIELTEEQKEILYSPVGEDEIEIRPDGLIYLPWMEYAGRLRGAFGLTWAIIPHGNPKINGNLVLWPFYLIIQGKLAGYAIGEQEWQPTNLRMTWGDACESAKSNALMRLCKGIGISLELWRPSFIRNWKERWAEERWVETKRGKQKQWFKKGTPTPSLKAEEKSEISGGEVESKREIEKLSPAQQKKISIMKKEGIKMGAFDEKQYYEVLGEYHVKHSSELSKKDASDFIERIQKKINETLDQLAERQDKSKESQLEPEQEQETVISAGVERPLIKE